MDTWYLMLDTWYKIICQHKIVWVTCQVKGFYPNLHTWQPRNWCSLRAASQTCPPVVESELVVWASTSFRHCLRLPFPSGICIYTRSFLLRWLTSQQKPWNHLAAVCTARVHFRSRGAASRVYLPCTPRRRTVKRSSAPLQFAKNDPINRTT